MNKLSEEEIIEDEDKLISVQESLKNWTLLSILTNE